MKPDARIVKLLFDTFNESIGDLPICHRTEIFNILVVKKFKFLNRVLEPETLTADIFLICSGKAIQMRLPSHYADFTKSEKALNKEKDLKDEFLSKPNFTAKSNMSFCILSWVM